VESLKQGFGLKDAGEICDDLANKANDQVWKAQGKIYVGASDRRRIIH
jgi:hypothetical protein